MRGTDCTSEGNLSISFIRAFVNGARNELSQTRKENSGT